MGERDDCKKVDISNGGFTVSQMKQALIFAPSIKRRQPHGIIVQIKAGFPVARFKHLGSALAISEDQLAKHLGISRATLHRRKQSGRFDPWESDRLHRFSRLLDLATEVFDGTTEARQWLSTSQVGLGGAIPLDYSETEEGAREVERLLGRIEHGVYA